MINVRFGLFSTVELILGAVLFAGAAGVVQAEQNDACEEPIPCDSSASCTVHNPDGQTMVTDLIIAGDPNAVKLVLKAQLEKVVGDSPNNPGCAECEFNDACTSRVFIRDGEIDFHIELNPETGLYHGVAVLWDGGRFTVDCSKCVKAPHIDPQC